MGKLKKGGQDTRGAKAKAQKAAARNEKARAVEKERQKVEDASWEVGANSRAAKKQQDSLQKEEEKRLKSLEKKALLAAEEVELSNMKKPKGKARKGQKAKKKKNDLSALDSYLNEEKKAAEKKKLNSSRLSNMQDLIKNNNKTRAAEEKSGTFSASGLDSAIDALNLAQSKTNTNSDKHPEKRAKAAYAAFEERRMNEIKIEYPGLKRSQYKEKLWKEWQKSPENPFNQQE